jgi:mRNA interferase MazF
MVKRGQIWWANLDPGRGTEPGKIRPVVIIQTDLLNQAGHPSTIICPLSTQVQKAASLLRVHLKHGEAGLAQDSDILIDQIRAIDNSRLTAQIGMMPTQKFLVLEDNLRKVLDL